VLSTTISYAFNKKNLVNLCPVTTKLHLLISTYHRQFVRFWTTLDFDRIYL